jgi:ketosteroid isomerase-like protein
MSQENVERLRALYAEMACGNFGNATELLAPDFVYEPMADGRQTLVGVGAFTRQFREFLCQWSEFRIEALELEDLGETVLVTERQRGKGRASGIETEMTFFSTWTFRDGLVVRARWDSDRAGALEAAGKG